MMSSEAPRRSWSRRGSVVNVDLLWFHCRCWGRSRRTPGCRMMLYAMTRCRRQSHLLSTSTWWCTTADVDVSADVSSSVAPVVLMMSRCRCRTTRSPQCCRSYYVAAPPPVLVINLALRSRRTGTENIILPTKECNLRHWISFYP